MSETVPACKQAVGLRGLQLAAPRLGLVDRLACGRNERGDERQALLEGCDRGAARAACSGRLGGPRVLQVRVADLQVRGERAARFARARGAARACKSSAQLRALSQRCHAPTSA